MSEKTKRGIDALEKARLHLQKFGWTQYTYQAGPGGPCCLVGALNRGCGRIDPLTGQHSLDPDVNGAFHTATTAVRLVVDAKNPGLPLTSWNDQSGRTLDQVDHLLLEAIHLLKERETKEDAAG